MIRSACRTVASRCAMINEVRPRISVSNASWISPSLSESNELVASSKINIAGFFNNARAIATRWRCPPESLIPRSPTNVA